MAPLQTEPTGLTASSPSIAPAVERRAFHTLDGLRGVAAMFIVCRHVGALFSGVAFNESFLAVDLFFVLSGFVIAHAYDTSLARGGFAGRFIVLRLIRLYPLYLIGIGIGAAHILSLMLRHGDGLWTPARFMGALAMNSLFLPSPFTGSDLFPLDHPVWTLLLEIVANVLYAVFWRRLTDRVLVGVVVVAGVVMVISAVACGTLDIGWTAPTLLLGYSRVLFSFPLGVLICRRMKRRHKRSAWAPWLSFGVLALVLALNPPPSWRVAYELAAALLVFPVLVAWASGVEPNHGRDARVMAQMGVASYAVYVLHAPAADLFQSLSHSLLKIDWWKYAPASGFIYLLILVAITVPLDLWYDKPVRVWLRRLTSPSRGSVTPAARP